MTENVYAKLLREKLLGSYVDHEKGFGCDAGERTSFDIPNSVFR
jgi:hypothetical protein